MSSEAKPILQTPGVLPVARRPSKVEEGGITPPKAPKGPDSLVWRSITWLPSTLYKMCQNSAVMGFMIEGLDVASNVCARAGETGVVPYLSLPATPLYFAHTVTKVKKRLQLAMTAAKVSMADAVLHGLQAVEAFGGSVGTLAQSLGGGAKLASLTQYAVIGLIFSYILPRFLLTTSSIGMFAGVWSLLRNNYALSHFQDKKEEGFVEAIAFLSGQRPRAKVEDKHSDVVAQEVLKSKKEEAKETHFLSGAYDTKKIEKFFTSLDLKHHFSNVALPKNDSLEDVGNLIQNLLNPNKSSMELLQDVVTIYGRLDFENAPQGLEGFFTEMKKKRDSLIENCEQFVNMAENDIRNELANHTFSLFIMVLILTASSLSINNPSDPFIPSMLSISASTLSMGMILYEGFLSEKSRREFDKFLETVRKR